MMTFLAVVGILALWWCAVSLASVWLEHMTERRAARDRHPTRRTW